MLRGKKFLTSAVVAAFVVLSSGIVATSARAISYSIPQGQELYGLDPNSYFLVELDPVNGLAVKVDPNADPSPLAGYVEGGGYDPVTQSTWVVEDSCQLYTVIPSGFSTPQFSLGSDYRDCWAFLANGDGTAYVSATKVSTNMTVVVEVNLNTNQVGSVSELATASPLQITGMSRNSSGEVWVSTYGSPNGIARLNFDGAGDLYINDVITLEDEVWDIAFDADGILWLAAWPDGFELKAIDLASQDPLSTLFNAGAFNYPFAGGFETDAMWFPNAYTYATRASEQSPSPSPSASPSQSASPSPSSSPSPSDSSISPAVSASESLAVTGFEIGGYLILSGVVVALGVAGILISRRKIK